MKRLLFSTNIRVYQLVIVVRLKSILVCISCIGEDKVRRFPLHVIIASCLYRVSSLRTASANYLHLSHVQTVLRLEAHLPVRPPE